jgi:ketosteroid isomerase-like protein
MSTEQNKTIIRRWLEGWNKGSQSGLEALAEETFTADFVIFDKGQPGEVAGIEGVKQFVGEVFKNSSDVHITVEDLIAEGDVVVARYTVRGVNKATGEADYIVAIDCNRFSNGKVAESRGIDVQVEPKPKVVVKAMDAACNAGDLERVMAFFADDAVLKASQDPKIYAGKQQIREWFAPQMNHLHVLSKDHQVTGDSVTWMGTLTGDIVKQMGSESIDSIAEAVVQGGKIASFTLIFTARRS